MKENLAAAVLYRAGWPQLAATHPQLLDPMCGSGTLLIEAAMMAADVAPGLLRQRFGFSRWLQHDKGLWRELHAEAVQRRDTGLAALAVRFTGYDRDASVLQIAEQNFWGAAACEASPLAPGAVGRPRRAAGEQASG
jgi:23S rRNA (guanine2445-N2)-methyltransferase / 23S rRNA (guanine2069-N7)-methyltransferase